jgi:hypothetical protein
MDPSHPFRLRLLAAGSHLAASALLAAAVALLTLGLWYPGDFAEMAGGKRLFLLILGVDVVMGPLLTLIVFNIRKPRNELIRDLAVIAVLQLAALAYGLHTLYAARPVALAYEPGRFRVVAANQVPLERLPSARPEYRHLPLTGPWILGTRATRPEERLRSLEEALNGIDIGQRPERWQPYAESREAILSDAKPVADLLRRHEGHRQELLDRLAAQGLDPARSRFLPIVARGEWVALLDERGEIVGYAPFDGF